jgi:hypothetical protein
LALPKKPQINWLINGTSFGTQENTSPYIEADAFANESIEKLKPLLNS